MKYLICAFMLLCFVKFGSTNNREVLSKIFEAHNKYVQEQIPDKYRRYYLPITEIDHKTILDTLVSLTDGIDLTNLGKCYFIQAVSPSYEWKSMGVFWTDEMMVVYRWNNNKMQIKIVSDNKHYLSKTIVSGIENWTESVTNRSYYNSSIAGAWFNLGSNITICGDKLDIKTTAFADYDDKHFMFYLKEIEEDGFKRRVINNPNY